MKKTKTIKITHQDGYEIGVEGQLKGTCCGNWCFDCDFIRRKLPEFKDEYDKKYSHLRT